MGKAESCHNCVYSRWSPGQWLASLSSGFPARPTCANQPESPGRWAECPLGKVCRNFRARPPTPKGETVKTIPVGEGLVAYVDAADFEWLNQWVWYLHGEYAARCEKGQIIFMHREIMKPPEGMVVDHKHRNKMDNTRESLRVCTHAENACNRSKKRGSSSRFMGVSYLKEANKWDARIGIEGKRRRLGLYVEEVEAARAYDHKAVELAGEFARLNFPEEWPPERIREVHAHRSEEDNSDHGQDARATGRAKPSRRAGGKRVSRARERAGGKKSHGQDARAAKPSAKKKEKRSGRRVTRAARKTASSPARGKRARPAPRPKAGRGAKPKR